MRITQHKLTNVSIYVLWVRVDLARIGMIAEFSTLRFPPSPFLFTQMKRKEEGGEIYLWRVELARLNISTHQFGI